MPLCLVEDREASRQYLDDQIAAHPELFPEGIEVGYRFHGRVESSRQQIKTRRVLLPRMKEAYQRRPDFVMPYMSETAEMADKALYLRKHGLAFEGSASAGQDGLTEAYGMFQQEAAHYAPDYAPETLTTDGWDATRAARETVFPGIVWILS